MVGKPTRGRRRLERSLSEQQLRSSEEDSRRQKCMKRKHEKESVNISVQWIIKEEEVCKISE